MMFPASCPQFAACHVVTALLLNCFLFVSTTYSAEPAIRVVADARGQATAFEATGFLRQQLEALAAVDLNQGTGLRLFSVYVADSGTNENRTPMLGRYQWREAALRFTPQFPLCPGLTYRAEFRPDATLSTSDSNTGASTYLRQDYRGKPVKFEHTIPKSPDVQAPEVAHIYPSANVLPENQLKFYLHFSAPMTQREAYQHLELLKADGTPVDLPFLELGEELWDGTGTRLTLLIDPGRIKQGVKPREDLGPVLEQGQEFTLVVHSDWKGVNGQTLARTARKVFRAGPPVHAAIDPSEWKITVPKNGTQAAIMIEFPRPLDRALLERTIVVKTGDGKTLPGKVEISNAESRWSFRPTANWNSGQYQLVIDNVLEDLAGNRIGRPFEVDAVGTVEKRVEVESTTLPFEIAK